MEIKDAIKNRILGLCTEKGITIKELANLSGLRSTTIYSIISGKSCNPGFITIQKICLGLNVSISKFFDDTLFEFDDIN